MIVPVQVTSDERDILLQWRKDSGSLLVRDRAHAVLLNGQGLSAHRISALLFRTEKTVRIWLDGFRQQRLSSLFPQYRGNTNAGKLTPDQQAQIRQVLSQPPSDYGIPKEFWQIRDLKRYISTEFGVVYESDRSYHFLFRLNRFSWKLPDRFDVKRDDARIAIRLREIREEIAPLLQSPHWVVLASDEARLIWESESRRAWLRTNRKTILKVHRSQEYQSFLGSLNLKTGRCHLHTLSWQNQDEVIKALKKLGRYYSGKRLCVVWDNARWHRGKKISRALRRGNSLANVHLVNFPPYAPDTNPQEHVWKYARDKIVHQPTRSFKQKVNNFKLAVIHRRFDYQI